MPQPGQTEQNVFKAGLWMAGAVAAFSTMAIGGREALRVDLDTFELMLYRSIVGFCIVIIVAFGTGNLSSIKRRHLHLHFLRNVTHFAGQNLWFYALTLIPLAQVFALEFTSPLWVVVFAPFVLGERITPTRIAACVLGFIGILVITRPGTTEVSPGTIFAAVSAICFAATAVVTKKLTRSVPIMSILFWLTVQQGFLGLICAGFDGQINLPPTAAILPVFLVGFCGIAAHFCLTNALSMAPSVVVMSMDFTRLPIIAIVGMLLYQEPLEVAIFAGAALIFLGNFINMKAESRH